MKSVRERFEAKVDRSGGLSACHLWIGAITLATGYGSLRINRRAELAHRLALEFRLGRKLRSGYQANHTCDNRRCVNPEHLYEGTQAENIRDAIARNRFSPPPRNDVPPPIRRGEANNRAVMTEDGVRRLREERASTGASYSTLAERWGISRATVAQIVRRATWKEVMP